MAPNFFVYIQGGSNMTGTVYTCLHTIFVCIQGGSNMTGTVYTCLHID